MSAFQAIEEVWQSLYLAMGKLVGTGPIPEINLLISSEITLELILELGNRQHIENSTSLIVQKYDGELSL